MTIPCSVRVHPSKTDSRGVVNKSSGSSSSAANIERRRHGVGFVAIVFRILGRGAAFARLKNDEAGVGGSCCTVVDDVVFPITRALQLISVFVSWKHSWVLPEQDTDE